MTLPTFSRPINVQGLRRGVARVLLSHTDLTTAGTSQAVTLATLAAAHPTNASEVPANSRVLYAWINLLEVFAGGTVSALVLKLGDAGSDNELITNVDCFTGATLGLKVVTGAYTLGTFEATAYGARVTATSTTDNVVSLTTGLAEICIAYETIDTDVLVSV